MEPLRRATEMKFLSDRNEISKMPQFNVPIHMQDILMQQNKILDVLHLNRHNSVRTSKMPEIEIRPLRLSEDESAFRELNEE